MKEEKQFIVRLLIVLVFVSVALSYKNYCNQKEYFYVYQSIVFPLGSDYQKALEMSKGAHLGYKNVCRDVSSRSFR